MIKTILVSHAPPTDENSPYHTLAKEWNLEFDFHNFVHVEGISASEFRKQNINPLDYTAIIFTSKQAINHFFRICKDLRIEMPADTKYFCMSTTLANYLQKYIVIRKRKLYIGEKTPADIIALMKKHSKEKFLFPCGDNTSNEITNENSGCVVKPAIVFQMVPNDLSEVLKKHYDMVCLFSPLGIDALLKSNANLKDSNTLIAVYGPSTAKAAQEKGLRIDVLAPQPDTPSLTMAIENFLKQNYKKEQANL
ncbi:MAG: uroporphyrinogen-III synthase [Bacteroidia bacterium]|nr:uroporphyrinogen-III synthase [Bacteroidia bacterium]MDW8159745.1 uroporphyrinogen-III synthase [Bacteroidia bacterium]